MVCNKKHGPSFKVSGIKGNLQTKQNKQKTQMKFFNILRDLMFFLNIKHLNQKKKKSINTAYLKLVHH